MNRKEFDNGLVLLTEKRPNTKKAALLVGVKVGSVNEDDRLSGGSHFNEHLLFKSNKYRSARQIIEDLEYSGIIIDASTNWKYTAFHAKAPHGELTNAIEILFQAATNFSYDPGEFSTEREVILTEIQNYINLPDRHFLFGLFIPTLFRGTPLARKVEGTTGSVKNITKEELGRFKEDYYVPNNTAIVAVGRFNEEKLIRKIKATFGKLKAREVPNPEPDINLDNNGFERFESRKDISQLYLGLGYRVPGFSHKDVHKIDLLSAILSAGLSSRMFKELREKRGIGYKVGSFFYPLSNEGIFCIYVCGFNPKRFEETKEILLGIFDDLKNNPISDREFDGIKNLMVSRYDDRLEMIRERARMILETEFYKIPYDFRREESYIRKILKEDLMDTARRYLTGRYSLTVLTPEGFRV